MRKHPLFSQKCWSFTLPRHEEYKRLINQIILADKTDPNFNVESKEQTNVYAWKSDWHSDEHFPILDQLCNEIKPYFDQIIKEEKLKNTTELDISACWINKYKKGDFAQAHIHNPNEWSVVYFMKIPKDSLCVFRIHNPLGTTYNSGLLENFSTLDINTEEGSVVIMSGAMRHEVTPNQSEEERITVAMHFRIFDKFAVRNNK
tara:strand:+ start:382 stop:990 length:609 start_codon:yes stop_codon:yes gene_type:complete